MGLFQALDWAREEMIVTTETGGDGCLEKKGEQGIFNFLAPLIKLCFQARGELFSFFSAPFQQS